MNIFWRLSDESWKVFITQSCIILNEILLITHFIKGEALGKDYTYSPYTRIRVDWMNPGNLHMFHQ